MFSGTGDIGSGLRRAFPLFAHFMQSSKLLNIPEIGLYPAIVAIVIIVSIDEIQNVLLWEKP